MQIWGQILERRSGILALLYMAVFLKKYFLLSGLDSLSYSWRCGIWLTCLAITLSPVDPAMLPLGAIGH
jgi:hypothetical protein